MGKLTTHQRKARDLMQREDWDGALTELQRVLGMDANNPTLHNQIGDVYLRKGAIDQACDHFEMAVDLYSNLRLHNNAVALCRKVVRLAPTRVEVRYHLARLRMDQGLRTDATSAFVDYLDHAQPVDDEAADALEQRCVEIVESFPDLAPVGQIVEKLETVKRPQGAYKIVQRAAQRATDSGDTAAAQRFTEKMRSLRVLLESQGGEPAEASSTAEDAVAVEHSAEIPEIDSGDSPGDPAELRSDVKKPSMVDPTAIDLPSETQDDVAAKESVAESERTVPEAETPEAQVTDEAAMDTSSQAAPVAEDADVPEIDLDDAGSLDEAVAELQDVLDLDVPDATQAGAAAPDETDEVNETNAADNAPASVEDSMMPEYELPETSLEEVANLLEQEGLEPTGDSGKVDAAEPVAPVDTPAAADLLLPEDANADDVDAPAVPEATSDRETPALLQPEEAPGSEPEPSSEVASIAETFAEPPAVEAQEEAPPEAVPQEDAEDRPASVVYEPAPGTRRPGATDDMRRAPVWIPSPNAVSPDPDPSEEGQTQELEEVIDTFREQMARALGDDGAARYDLGVAYYEMGLYNEALAEFEVAVKCPGLNVRTLEMMSSCLAQQGRHDEVVSLLEGPLAEVDDSSQEDRLSLQYAMGLALEAVGQQEDARRHFEEVALVDIGFKDVQSRLQR